MEAKRHRDHAERVGTLNGRNLQSWHGTAPPALDGAAGQPSLRNLFPNYWKTGAFAIMIYVYECIALGGEVTGT
jgi:hypothetical protein